MLTSGITSFSSSTRYPLKYALPAFISCSLNVSSLGLIAVRRRFAADAANSRADVPSSSVVYPCDCPADTLSSSCCCSSLFVEPPGTKVTSNCARLTGAVHCTPSFATGMGPSLWCRRRFNKLFWYFRFALTTSWRVSVSEKKFASARFRSTRYAVYSSTDLPIQCSWPAYQPFVTRSCHSPCVCT